MSCAQPLSPLCIIHVTDLIVFFSSLTPIRKVFGTGVGPSRRPVDTGTEKWHYNGIKRKDGIVVPPMPDKKKGIRPNSTVPVYTPTPVLPAVNSINSQLGETKTVTSILPAPPQLGTTTTIAEPATISPSSPILKAQLSAPLRPSSPSPGRSPQVMYCWISVLWIL